MSQETFNLILGALIGFIPTLILTLLSYRQQIEREKLLRQWQETDLERTRTLTAIEKRYNQIEDFVASAMKLVRSASLILDDRNLGPRVIQEHSKPLNQLIIESVVIEGAANSTAKQDLIDPLLVFIKLLNDLKHALDHLAGKPGSPTPEPESAVEIEKIDLRAMELYQQIITRLDELRSETALPYL